MVFEKIMRPGCGKRCGASCLLAPLRPTAARVNNSRHTRGIYSSKTITAGATNAYPFSVAAATVDTDHRYQPSLPRLERLCDRSPGFEKRARVNRRCRG